MDMLSFHEVPRVGALRELWISVVIDRIPFTRWMSQEVTKSGLVSFMLSSVVLFFYNFSCLLEHSVAKICPGTSACYEDNVEEYMLHHDLLYFSVISLFIA